MDTETKNEIDTLHQMVQNWKVSYFTFYSTDGVNEWIMEDFIEEISTHLIPYLHRLQECSHITGLDAANFFGRTDGEIEDLRRLLRL